MYELKIEPLVEARESQRAGGLLKRIMWVGKIRNLSDLILFYTICLGGGRGYKWKQLAHREWVQ